MSKTPELLLAEVLPELSSAVVVEEESLVLVDADAEVTPGPVEKPLERSPPHASVRARTVSGSRGTALILAHFGAGSQPGTVMGLVGGARDARMLGRMLHRTAGVLMLALVACGEDERECLTPAAVSSGEPSGALVWQEAFHATESDFGLTIAVDPCDGRVAVGGRLDPHVINATSDIWIGALSHAGEPLWDWRIHELFSEAAGAVAFDGDGSLLVAGASEIGPYIGSDIDAGWLARFDAHGAESWRAHLEKTEEERDVSYQFADVAVAPDGRIFVAGARKVLYGFDALAAAYDSAGELLWTVIRDEYPSSSALSAVSVLPGGDVLFAGVYGAPVTGESSLLLRRFSADGELLDERIVAGAWRLGRGGAFTPTSLVLFDRERLVEMAFDGQVLREAALTDEPNDLALGRDGDVYLVGSRGVGGTELVPSVTRLDSDLKPVWEYVHDRPGWAIAVTAGPSGDAFVTGLVEAPPIGGASNFRNHDIWIARFAR